MHLYFAVGWGGHINKPPAIRLTIFLTASSHQHSKPSGGFEQSNKSPVAVQVTMVILGNTGIFSPVHSIGYLNYNLYVNIFHFPHFP